MSEPAQPPLGYEQWDLDYFTSVAIWPTGEVRVAYMDKILILQKEA